MPDSTSDRGLVFSIDRFVAEDGPGVRTTVFLKGCPIHCAWCHSPQSIPGTPQLLFYASRCIRCGACVKACPHGAQLISSEDRVILWNICEDCGQCAEACPAGALVIEGKWLTVDQIVDVVKRDMVYYNNSGGGVTFSGGEATFQPNFLTACLKACKELEIHTAVDTCGVVSWPVLETILSYTDLFLFDLKHMDSDTHKKLTGTGNELILRNLRNLSSRQKPIWIRIPLIPGCNDSDENLRATADFVKPLAGVEKITLLPYNDATSAKYGFIGKEYTLEGTVPHPDDEYREIVKAFSQRVGRDEQDLLA